MKILITGSSGFVGQHLINYALKKQKKIYGTYLHNKPAARQGVVYARCDCSQFQPLLSLIKKVRPTHIFHLVGQSSASQSWQCPMETLQSNLFSSVHLVEACRQLGLRPKILFSSSAHVYGELFSKKHRVSETDTPQPMDPYASSKLQAESVFLQYWKQFKIPCVITRAAAHIGSGQKPSFSISNFSMQISEIEKRKQPPVIWVGDTSAERGFVAIEDMVEAYWLAIQKGIPGEIYNIGAQRTKPMRDWIQLLLGFSRANIQVRVDPVKSKVVEVRRILVNSSKFRKLAGWKERKKPAACFREILEWWRTHAA